MYHRVIKNGEVEGTEFVVNVDVFERQLQYFAEQGYYTPPLAHVLGNCYRSVGKSHKPLIITFDDGYVDTLENAAPLLRQYGFSAIVFVVSDFSRRTNWWDARKGIAQAQLMGKSEVRSLHEMGIEIGSHGWSHRSLPLLNDEELTVEFDRSRKTTEDVVGQSVRYFAYPYGEVDERVEAAARRAGYVCAFATNSGPMFFHSDLFQIRRTNIRNRSGKTYLYTKLSGIEKTLRYGWSVTKKLIGKKPKYNST